MASLKLVLQAPTFLESFDVVDNGELQVNHLHIARRSKGSYLVLPNRDTFTATLMAHCLTWHPHLPYLECSSHCLI